MVSMLDFGLSGPRWNPGCVVFLDKTLYSHIVTHHLGVYIGSVKFNPAMD